MARDTLAQLIAQLRGMVNAGTADYCVGTVDYWSDDHIQAALDRHRIDVVREPLAPIERVTGGAVQFFEHQSAYNQFERTDGGTAVFEVEDGLGNRQGTAGWTADYARGRVRFLANTQGSLYFLTGRSYDLNAAAADIWRMKAAHFSSKYNVSTDGHRLERQGLLDNALKMADVYEAKQSGEVVEMYS